LSSARHGAFLDHASPHALSVYQRLPSAAGVNVITKPECANGCVLRFATGCPGGL
jgi:hypothetical protein